MPRLIRTGAALLLMGGVAMAEPFHHPYGEWREYNADWLAACPDRINPEDATSYYATSCFASTASAEKNDANLPAYTMSLILDRLTGARDVTFTVAPTDGTELDESRLLEVRFSGSPPMRFAFGSDLETRYNTVNQYFVVDSDQRDALLAAMRERNAATLVLPVDAGQGATKQVRLSMRGVLASIEFMQNYAQRAEPVSKGPVD